MAEERLMRVFVILCLLAASAQAQTPLDVGAPDAAFAGGPIRPSKNAAARLREHYQGDKVPVVPQPFRVRLDVALASGDPAKLDAARRDLIKARGLETLLIWEQSRFIATGGIGVAEMHAQDLAGTGASGVAETAAMLWLYAAGAILIDSRQCASQDGPDAAMERLRGPDFDAVTRILRTLADDRLGAMRTLAIRLETVLSPDRNSVALCRVRDQAAEVRPEKDWRPDALAARKQLPQNLTALTAIMRPTPAAKP